MALMRLPLDAATVMVASVALGIAVDDAVHFLEGYRWRRESLGAREALEHTMTDVGPALVVTTVTACIGFFAVCNSAFVPIRYFGLLAGAAMVVALAAGVVEVPAIMMLLVGEKELAIKYYKKSLEINPDNTNGTAMLQRLKSEKK